MTTADTPPQAPTGPRERLFPLSVLGRTLEHLGTQMYKRRDVAIAELVANAWDAGATTVVVHVPSGDVYDPLNASIVIEDDGEGMEEDDVENNYLVIGRDRRAAGQPTPRGRRPMGRKGVGKLAGFGLAQKMQVTTWREQEATEVTIAADELTVEAGTSKTIELPGLVRPVGEAEKSASGTRIELQRLKHKTPPHPEDLVRALGRRFSRTVQGEMTIEVNSTVVAEPQIEWQDEPAEMEEVALADGRVIKWQAGFSSTVLPRDLQGFTILAHGKTAQAPPYFFDVESTASGQHGTKYLSGVIEADFLDDAEEDIISTDRQEIDWDQEIARALHAWGDRKTRDLLLARAAAAGKRAKKTVAADPSLKARIDLLDKASRKQVESFIEKIGTSGADEARLHTLADTIIRAFEYQQFHDFLTDLDASAKEDPEELIKTLELMRDWKLLESRAVLEVIKGRLDIIDKFHKMIVNDSPETGHKKGDENMHDLIADYPWILNPDWQVFAEEKRITTQLREWGASEIPADDLSRYDFLALEGEGEFVVIEIKRAGHAVELKDVQQLERYREALGRGANVSEMVFISGGGYALSSATKEAWDKRSDGTLTTWEEVHKRTRDHYEHYRALLESETASPSFDRKAKEVARTRVVLADGAYRGVQLRSEGLGPQDTYHQGASDGTTGTAAHDADARPASDTAADADAEAGRSGGS